MKRIFCHLLLFLCLCVAPAQAIEYTVQTVPNVQVADRTQYVSDPINILGTQAHININTLLSQLRDSSSVEAAVVVLPSIGSEDIDNFTTELFMHWGIGKASNDNGLLILTVMDQRQIVIRTGYGIEGVLPDVVCSRIIRQYITPAFRDGEYGKGMTDAVQQIYAIVTNPEATAELWAEDAPLDETDKQLLLFMLYCYLAVSALCSLLVSIRLARIIHQHKNDAYECYKELDNSLTMLQLLAVFMPFWGIINLLYSNGAKKRMRNKARQCDQCGTTMHRLSETEDNYFLSPQEDAEEQVGSVDYDVWMCDNCRNTEVFRFDKKHTQYSECPQCHAKTYTLAHDHILRPASTLSDGSGERVYTCSYCKARKVLYYTIPMIVVPKGGSSGGGGMTGGGSFGGGFGGGMTGGGGARGGW